MNIPHDCSDYVYHYRRVDGLARATLEYKNILEIRGIIQFSNGEMFIIEGTKAAWLRLADKMELVLVNIE